MKVGVGCYWRGDGYTIRHWAVGVDGELLAVVLHRKGAEVITDRSILAVVANRD